MAKEKTPATPAVRVLKQKGVDFTPLSYKYIDKGGAPEAARQLRVDLRQVVKTLVMEDSGKTPFLVLMHGDQEVSTKALARELGVKSVAPCGPGQAQRYTGYQVGGISPFGTRKKLKIYIQRSILDLGEVFINAGKRGLLARMEAGELARVLEPVPVEAAR